jgi:hypothetical protein
VESDICIYEIHLVNLNIHVNFFRAYVSNRFADKLTKVSDNIYCCRSGSAADTQAIADVVAYHLGLHS